MSRAIADADCLSASSNAANRKISNWTQLKSLGAAELAQKEKTEISN